MGALVGGFEAGEENLERLLHLGGKRGGDLGLHLARVLEDGVELAVGRCALKPGLAQEHEEGVVDRAAAHFGHGVDREVDVAGGLAAWRVDQSKGAAVGQDSNRDAGFAKEPLELLGRRVFPGAGGGLGLIEVEAVGELPDQEPKHAAFAGGGRERLEARARRRGALVPRDFDAEGWNEGLVAVGGVVLEALREGVDEGRFAPAEVLGDKGTKVANAGCRGGRGHRGAWEHRDTGALRGWAAFDLRGFFEKLEEGAVVFDEALFEAVGLEERRDTDDQALGGLHHPKPGLVKVARWVAAHSRISGQRKRRPTGSIR